MTPGNEQDIKQVEYQDIFDPPKTYLKLAAKAVPDVEVNRNLVNQAIEDAKQNGLEINLFRVLRADPVDGVFFVFAIAGHDDLYWVYVSDDLQKRLIRKFRFSDS